MCYRFIIGHMAVERLFRHFFSDQLGEDFVLLILRDEQADVQKTFQQSTIFSIGHTGRSSRASIDEELVTDERVTFLRETDSTCLAQNLQNGSPVAAQKEN